MYLAIEPYQFGAYNKGLRMVSEPARDSEDRVFLSRFFPEVFLGSDGVTEIDDLRVTTDEALEWLDAAAKFIRENRERVES